MRLTDMQLVLLSAASQHESRAVILAPDLNGSEATKVVDGLLREKLLEEIPTKGSLPMWRRDKGGEGLALRITEQGLASIGVGGGEAKGSNAAAAAQTHSRSSKKEPRRTSRR